MAKASTKARALSNAQLPIAFGHCTFAGSPIDIITFSASTADVTAFISKRVAQVCVNDPALGRIEGAGYVIVAPGTTAEQVAQASGGTLAGSSCG